MPCSTQGYVMYFLIFNCTHFSCNLNLSEYPIYGIYAICLCCIWIGRWLTVCGCEFCLVGCWMVGWLGGRGLGCTTKAGVKGRGDACGAGLVN